MAKQPDVIRTTVAMKATAVKSAKPTGSSEDSNFSFGWENTAFDPLTYEARALVDETWPDTDTPDIVNGVWDDTPIMKAVMAAIKRGIEIGQGSPVATA